MRRIGLGTSPPKPGSAEPPPMRSMRDLEVFIETNGLEDIGALLRSRVRACFHLYQDPHAPDRPGASRLGGLPDLPAGTAWPADSERVPEFIAQLDLQQIAHEHGASALPSRGLLSIFAVTTHDPPSRYAIAMHVPAGTPLVRLAAPAGLRVFNPVPVRLESGITLPIDEALFDGALNGVAPDFDVNDIEMMTCGPRESLAQLLGHAVTFREDLLSQAALDALGHPRAARLLIWESWERWQEAKQISSPMANGAIYTPWQDGDDAEMRWLLANRDLVAKEIEQWQVLIKLKSNREMDFWINDADDLYLFIRNDDLEAGRFSRLRIGETQS